MPKLCSKLTEIEDRRNKAAMDVDINQTKTNLSVKLNFSAHPRKPVYCARLYDMSRKRYVTIAGEDPPYFDTKQQVLEDFEQRSGRILNTLCTQNFLEKHNIQAPTQRILV